jgi:hypothetical protein
MGLLDDANIADDPMFQRRVQVAVLRRAQIIMQEEAPSSPAGDASAKGQQEAMVAQQRYTSRRFFVQRVLDNTSHWGQSMARMIAADPEIKDGATDEEIITAVEKHWEAFSA